MGRISYGLYLWQQFFFTPEPAVTLSAAAEVFLPRVALTFAAATASYYLLERPLLSLRPRCFKPVSKQSRATLSKAIPSSIMEQ